MKSYFEISKVNSKFKWNFSEAMFVITSKVFLKLGQGGPKIRLGLKVGDKFEPLQVSANVPGFERSGSWHI